MKFQGPDWHRSADGEPLTDDVVVLTLPARTHYLSLPRMAAAAVAAQAEFDIERVEDVRLAVEELCLVVGVGRRDGRLVVKMEAAPRSLLVTCSLEEDLGKDLSEERSELAQALTAQLLDALTDEHGIDLGPRGSQAWFRVARQATP